MDYPRFFDEISTIKMVDPLSALLGTFEAGEVEFSYLDIVKAAGHSCPTVGGAYLMTQKALAALYPVGLPVRGMIEVAFKESLDEGVAGVIGNVISHITGATQKSGFKGVGGRFARHSLMHYDSDIPSSVRFSRVDTGACVDVFYDPSSVRSTSEQQTLMQKIMQGRADEDEQRRFGLLWQERVRKILIEHADDNAVIRVSGCQEVHVS